MVKELLEPQKQACEAHMKLVVQHCKEALSASLPEGTTLASLQVQIDNKLWRLMVELCSDAAPLQVSALIWAGAGGDFVEACLQAQEIPWPDEALRLRCAENAVGLLDNCMEQQGLIAKEAVPRLLKGLVGLEQPLCDAAAALASGVLESYGLCLLRLLSQHPGGKRGFSMSPCLLPWCDEAALAIDSLMGLLQRRSDLRAEDRRTTLWLLGELLGWAPPNLSFPGVRQLFLGSLQVTLKEAQSYLRTHQAFAKAVGEDELLRAFACIEMHRERELERQQRKEQLFRERNLLGAPRLHDGVALQRMEQGPEGHGAESALLGQGLLELLEGAAHAPES